MSQEINNHIILSHLDAPMRILFWPVEQVVACVCPLMLGVALDYFELGIFFSVITSLGFKTFKEKFGKGKFRAIWYWNFPTAKKRVERGLPPSYVREWIR